MIDSFLATQIVSTATTRPKREIVERKAQPVGFHQRIELFNSPIIRMRPYERGQITLLPKTAAVRFAMISRHAE